METSILKGTETKNLLRQHLVGALSLACLALILFYSSQGIDSLGLLILVVLVWYVMGTGVLIYAATINHRARSKKFHVKPSNWMVLAICFTLSGTILFTQWPLHLVFHISRSALDKEAAALSTGQTTGYPKLVGLFWVRQAEISPQSRTACFWTNPVSSNKIGFVNGGPQKAQHLNLWSTMSLAADWQFISED